MRRSYSAAGTFSLSLSRLDIEKPPGDIHRWRRTNLVVTGLWLLAFVQSPAKFLVVGMRNRTTVMAHPLFIALRVSCPRFWPPSRSVGPEPCVHADDRYATSAKLRSAHRPSGPGLSPAPGPSPRWRSRWTRSAEFAAPSDPLAGPAVVATILWLCGP